MKKIVFFHLLNDRSGSPKVLSQVVSVAQNGGYTTELYVGGTGEGFLSDVRGPVSRFWYRRFNNKYFTLVSYSFSQVDLFFKLFKYRKQDVVFYINTLLPFGAAVAGFLLGKKVVYHIHETSITPRALKTFLRAVVRYTSKKNIFVSNFMAVTESVASVPQVTIYNALNSDFSAQASKHTYLPRYDGCFQVLMVCSLKAYKGVFEFLEVATLLEASADIKFTLVLNASALEIEKFFVETKVPANVKLFGTTADVSSFYATSNILLNLSKPESWVETFGLTILEAMAFGIPCIVPPVGGPVELIEHEKQGYLFASDRTDEIAKKILFLSKSPEHCLAFSREAKIKSKQFSQQKFELDILKVLNAI